MTTDVNHEEPSLREEAVARLRKKRDLSAHVLSYLLVNAVLVGIWWATGAHFFWPVFPLAFWGIGVAFHVWDVFAPAVSEERIEREVERMSRR